MKSASSEDVSSSSRLLPKTLNPSVQAAKSASVHALSLITSLFDRIILTGLLVRFWGTSEFAQWTTIVSFASMIVIAELGFQQLVGNEITRAAVRGHGRAVNRILATALPVSLAFGIVSLVAVVGGLFIFDWPTRLGLTSPEMVPALIVLCISTAIKIARGPLLQAYRGVGEFFNFLLAEVNATLAAVLAACAAVFVGADAIVVACLYLVAASYFSVWRPFADIRKRYPQIRFAVRRPSRQWTIRTASELRYYGLFYIVSNLIQTGPILIIAFLGMTGQALAIFAIQRTLVNFVKTVSTGLSNAAGAELSKVSMSGDPDGLARGLRTLGRLNAALAALATVALVFYGDVVVGLWTGEPDLGSFALLATLLVPLIATAPSLAVQQAAVMTGRVRRQSYASAIYAAIALGGSVLLGSLYGIIGVAIALALGEIVAIGILSPLWASRELSLPYWPLVRSAGLVFLAVSAWSAIVAGTLDYLLGDLQLTGDLAALTGFGLLAALPVLIATAPAGLRNQVMVRIKARLQRGGGTPG